MDHIANRVIRKATAKSAVRRTGSRRRRPQRVRRTVIDAKKILELIEATPHLMNPEERLTQLASSAARLVGGDSCVIMLLEDADPGQPTRRPHLRSCFASGQPGKAWTREEEGAVRDAIVSGKRVLVDNSKSRCGNESQGQAVKPERGSIIACPVRIDGTIVGAISVVGRQAFCRFRPDDVVAIEIAGCLVGHALQSGRLQNLLKSQFAQLAMAREGGHSPDNALAISSGRPAQLARILAKSFYREMIKLGFESAQIIGAASEIISQLSGSLKKHKERWQRNGAGRRNLAADVQ